MSPLKKTPAALLAALALILAPALIAAGCGGDDDVSQEELEQAVAEAEEEAQAEAEVADLQKQVQKLRKQQGKGDGGDSSAPASDEGRGDYIPPDGSSGGGLPADAEDCGSGVYARSGTTSCSFALNVAADYYSVPGNTFTSFSPSTGQAYEMSCSGGAPVVCTGGNNAAVYLP